jgi:hypothetical protein
MWLKIFSIIPLVAEIALALMMPKKSIVKLADLGVRLAKLAAPKAHLPDANIMDLARWTEKTIADNVITSSEVFELAKILDVEIKVDV